MEIRWIESQFFDPYKIANEMIIVHHTGSNNGLINSLEGTIKWFKPDPWRETLKASAQYIIPRYETYIVQMVKDEHTSYHAGASSWRINGINRVNLNDRSIGIELQGDGNLIEYSPFQYEALIWLTRLKMEKFNIPTELVQGHEHVSPGRKVDPGRLFDWKYFRKEITKTQVVVPEPIPTPPTPENPNPVDHYPEEDDVKIPSGENRPLLARIFDFLVSLFK
ncbi:N-acetylmuramoyl-L-alanine amidase [candidate division KSB1 bacterium]|nr:N-acetylmuramoyl-L-alanine amidase [candidate division KSB1 bacterium]